MAEKSISERTSRTAKRLAKHLRAQVLIDDLISRGLSALVIAYLAAILIIVLIAGLAYLIVSLGSDFSAKEAFWTAFSLSTNPELPEYDEAISRVAFTVISLIVVLIGLFTTSGLYGILTTALDTYYEGLQRGFSPVLEEDHIAVLGYNDNVRALLEEIVAAHSILSRRTVLFVDDTLSREEIETNLGSIVGGKIRSFSKSTGCRIICRRADLRDADELRRCAIHKARAVIINNFDDAKILKTLLSVSSMLSKTEGLVNGGPTIVCVFRDPDYAKAAEHVACRDNLRVLSMSDTLSGLIAKTCYQPGLSGVMDELFSFEGTEFYTIKTPKELVGKSFDDTLCSFSSSIPAGIYRQERHSKSTPEIILNTTDSDDEAEYAEKMTLRDSDFIIVLAAKQAAADYLRAEVKPIENLPRLIEHRGSAATRRSILVLGYDDTFIPTIVELARYHAEANPDPEKPNCSITLLYRNKREDRVKASIEKLSRLDIDESGLEIRKLSSSHGTDGSGSSFNDIQIGSTIISFQSANSESFDLKTLEKVFLAGNYGNVIVLSDHTSDGEDADTETLLTLLHLHTIAENASLGKYRETIKPFYITSEIQRMENVDLAINEYVSDYIIGWKFIASIQVQIAEDRRMYHILQDLLDSKGAGIQLVRAGSCIDFEGNRDKKRIDFDALICAFRTMEKPSDRMLLLGFIDDETKEYVLCPKRDGEGRRIVKLAPQDQLIAIQNESKDRR